MKAAILLFGCLFFAKAHAFLDVETLPSFRTAQYPMGPYKKIVVFSAPRTGSSLVYNIARFLFESPEGLTQRHDRFGKRGLVFKTHRYHDIDHSKDDEEPLYLVPIRNPLDAAISTYRVLAPNQIRRATVRSEEHDCEFIIKMQGKHLAFAETLPHAIFIKFEDFEGDMDGLLDFFERNFSILIAPQDRQTMKEGYSKENVEACTESLKSFNQYLPLSGFHGKHIASDGYMPPDSVVERMNTYLEAWKPLFRKYGYFGSDKQLMLAPACGGSELQGQSTLSTAFSL